MSSTATTIDIDNTQILQLIHQYLHTHNLHTTLTALQHETHTTHTHITTDQCALLAAELKAAKPRWNYIIESLQNITLHTTTTLYNIYDLLVHSLLLHRTPHTAVQRVIEQSDVLHRQMRLSDNDRYNRIVHTVMDKTLDTTTLHLYTTDLTATVITQLQASVTDVPQNRLLTLLQNAVRYEVHTGLTPRLPSGSSYNLFTNTVSDTAQSQLTESVPNTNNTKVVKFAKPSQCVCAVYTTDGRYIVTASNDGYVEVWNSTTGKLSTDHKYQTDDKLIFVNDSVADMVLTRSSELVTIVTVRNVVYVYDLASGQQVRKFAVTGGAVSAVLFSVDTSQLYTACSDGCIRLYGLKSTKLLKTYSVTSGQACNTVQCVEDESMLITGSADGHIYVFDTATTECVQTVSISALLAGNRNKQLDIKAVNNTSATIVQTLIDVHHSTAYNVFVYVCDHSNAVKLISIDIRANTAELVQLYVSDDGANDSGTKGDTSNDFVSIALSQRGSYLYALTEASFCYCFNAQTGGNVVSMVKAHDAVGTLVVHHPNYSHMASAAKDSTLKLWSPSR